MKYKVLHLPTATYLYWGKTSKFLFSENEVGYFISSLKESCLDYSMIFETKKQITVALSYTKNVNTSFGNNLILPGILKVHIEIIEVEDNEI